jgi:hypothetical protein
VDRKDRRSAQWRAAGRCRGRDDEGVQLDQHLGGEVGRGRIAADGQVRLAVAQAIQPWRMISSISSPRARNAPRRGISQVTANECEAR